MNEQTPTNSPPLRSEGFPACWHCGGVIMRRGGVSNPKIPITCGVCGQDSFILDTSLIYLTYREPMYNYPTAEEAAEKGA